MDCYFMTRVNTNNIKLPFIRTQLLNTYTRESDNVCLEV